MSYLLKNSSADNFFNPCVILLNWPDCLHGFQLLTIKKRKDMKVKFLDYNQMDNMRLDVDAMSQDVIFADEKRDESNTGTFFVRIYSDGLADFGYTVDCDSWHDNKPYTWSSNPECINKVFNLEGSLKLAAWTIGVRDDDLVYVSRGITFERACEIALENEELLHYGYMAFFCKNHTF